MTDDIFYPIEEAETMVAAFCDGSLPSEEWNHGTHLVMGLYMLAKYKEEAFAKTKAYIQNFAQAKGSDGYHETMTRFWVWAIRHYHGQEFDPILWNQEQIDAIIFNDHLTRVSLWEDYYSDDVMMADIAKRAWLEPDKVNKTTD